ncbi:MAG: SUMF1/EgtB/PvdO family nonheme iron enzyme, partial [Alphaproteobacteria bacterium]
MKRWAIAVLLVAGWVAPAAAQLETFKDCDGCPELVLIPAGDFLMGSPKSERGRDRDEGPQHPVSIRQAFALGKYEVTRGEYAAFVD